MRMAKKKRNILRNFRTIVLLFFLPLALVLLVRVVVPWKATLHSIYMPKAVATPKPINVLEIRYYPSDPVGQEAKTQILSDGLSAAMSDASMFHAYKDGAATKYSQVVIKRSIERDTNSPNTTGIYPTYYHSMDTMLTADGENLCDYIVANDIDQVWFWKHVGDGTADSGGFNLEYYRVWSTSHFPIQYPPPLCGGRRSFLVLGLDQDRATQEALHSYGHSTESLIGGIEGYNFFWQNFTGGSHETCGNVHFPPNGTSDYDYANPATVVSSCEDWHPDGSGATTSITCSRWNCLQLDYLKWWFQNMPNDGNTFTQSGKTLPNWWDFASDTDAAITSAVSANKYISPAFLDSYRPSSIDTVSGTAQASGTSLSYTQTISGSNRLLILGASYRSPSHSTNLSGNEQITAVTIGSTPLTRVNRTIFHEYATELWYVVASPIGAQTVSVTFASGAQDQVVASVNFVGIDQSTPFDTATGYQAGTASNVSNPTISIPSTTDQLLFGVVSMYTGTNNELGVSDISNGVWGASTTNVIGKAALATGGPSSSLSWTSRVAWPWSISAVAINFIQATPTPVPTSVPGPSCNSQCTQNDQCPSDLICDSGLCRRPGCTALDSCTCGPSCNSSCNQTSDCPSDLICAAGLCRRPGCTAVDSCTCGTPIPATFTPIPAKLTKGITVSTKKASVDIKANGLDTLNVYPQRTARLTWTSKNVSSCIASGSWFGQTLINGSMTTPPIFTTTIYKILCTGIYGKAQDQVTLTSFP